MKNENQTRNFEINEQKPCETTLAGTIRVCRNLAAQFNQLKDRLLQRLASEVNLEVPGDLLNRSMVEAEALAWSTPFPLLFLPVLAEEKVQGASQWVARQRQIRQHQQQAVLWRVIFERTNHQPLTGESTL